MDDVTHRRLGDERARVVGCGDGNAQTKRVNLDAALYTLPTPAFFDNPSILSSRAPFAYSWAS